MTDKRIDCPMRHENGNCTVAGGFCTSVNDPICEALHNAYDCGYTEAIHRVQEERRWISCKEKLPAKNQKVIFYCPSSDAIYTGRFNYVGKNGTVWFHTGRTACSYGGSHWMPLPEPPKEDAK